MATSISRNVNFVMNLKNNATKELQGFHGQLKQIEPELKKMAIMGTAAFAGITAVAYKAVGAAAENEGAWNKFNTVFGEHAKEMGDWITDVRQRLPSATTDIVKMASGIQDLLIPMGFARDEAMGMTQETIELANALAAFNDVPVEQVLEAMISGFSGMTRPLKQFGVDVPVERLEAMARQQGIVESGFKELDFETQRIVKAQLLLQAAYEDSADALGGFEVNQDSFIRRQQELRATLSDLMNDIGDSLLPMFDDALKRLIPLVDKIADWIRENPDLVRQIILLSGAMAGLVAIAGTLGLLLLAITTPALVITGVIAGLAAVSFLVVRNWEKIKETLEPLTDTLKHLWGIISTVLTPSLVRIKESIKNLWLEMLALWNVVSPILIPILKTLGFIIGAGLFGAIGVIIGGIKLFIDTLNVLINVFKFVTSVIKMAIEGWVSLFKWLWNILFGNSIIPDMVEGFKNAWNAIVGIFSSAQDRIVSIMENIIGWAQRAIDLARRARELAGGAISGARDRISSGLSRITPFANGGIVTRPTLGLVGEAGPEAIIPLNKAGGMGMTININGGFFGSDAGEEIGDQIIKRLQLANKL